jgi:DNA-binding transcriptional ArsR family regulator
MAHNIDTVFSALADSNRRQILVMLSEKDMSVNSIAGKFKVSRPAISKHLKVLTRSKLVKPKRKGRQRYYSLNAAPLNEVKSWLKFYEKFWNEKLNLLKSYVEESK